MANMKSTRLSYNAGQKGRNRVRAYQDSKSGRFYVEWWVRGKRDGSRQLPASYDWYSAKQAADEIAAELGKLVVVAKPRQERLTLASLFDNYVKIRSHTKCPRGQSHDRACVEMFLRFFGPNRDPRTIRRQEGERFAHERKRGLIAPNTRRSPRGRRRNLRHEVSDRVVEKDLKWLSAVFNWALEDTDETGEPYLTRNPLRSLKLPKAQTNPPRISHEHYECLLEAAGRVGWRHKLMLVLAHETGHRRGAIRQLEWRDIVLEDEPEGQIDWPAETDKIRRRHKSALSQAAVDALRAARKESGSFKWVFPNPSDPSKCCADDYVAKWWREVETEAGIKHTRGLGFHSLRRKFATDLHEQGASIQDIKVMGGWKSTQTLLSCYIDDSSIERQVEILRRRTQKAS